MVNGLTDHSFLGAEEEADIVVVYDAISTDTIATTTMIADRIFEGIGSRMRNEKKWNISDV